MSPVSEDFTVRGRVAADGLTTDLSPGLWASQKSAENPPHHIPQGILPTPHGSPSPSAARRPCPTLSRKLSRSADPL